MTTPATADEVAVVTTNHGLMVVEFWPDVAPKTVGNFKKLTREGFYDGTAFHRILRGFMIQGGDPLTKNPANEARWGTGDPGYKIKAEFNDRHHEKGVLSMARSTNPDSAGCQFFICHGEAGFLDRQYTAFGRLLSGLDTLEKIASVECLPAGESKPSRPKERVSVESVRLVDRATLPA